MVNGTSTALMNALLGYMQDTPTSWDWEGGEAAPAGIRTPWLGYAWHLDELGRIVPNDPNHPRAPWNQPGSAQTYEAWLAGQQPSSIYNAPQKPARDRSGGAPHGVYSNLFNNQSKGKSQTFASRPVMSGNTYGAQRNPLQEAIRRLLGGM